MRAAAWKIGACMAVAAAVAALAEVGVWAGLVFGLMVGTAFAIGTR